MNAYIYLYNLSCPPEHITYPLLPKERKLQDKPHYALSRYLIRHTLEKHHIPIEKFHYEPNGKPALNHPNNISLSHSKNIFIVALMQTKKLGVDIQIDFMKKEHLFKKRYNLQNYSTAELLTHWVTVEAYCKAHQSKLISSLYSDIHKKIEKAGLYLHVLQQPFPIGLVCSEKITELILINKYFSGKGTTDWIK